VEVSVRARVVRFCVALLLSGAVTSRLGAAEPPPDRADDPSWYSDPRHAQVEYDPTWEFSLGLGYSRVEFKDSPPLVDGRDCFHAEPVLSVAPFSAVPQLRLGAAVGWTLAVDDTKGAVISGGNGLVIATSSDVNFMLFEPELRLSWRQPFGPDGLYFIEAGAAAGAAVGWLDVSGQDQATAADADITDTDASFEWKVFLRAGLPVSNGLAGIEASYMRAGRIDFSDDIGGDPSEFYIGIFGSLQF
jgi:hypothetical protein